MDARPKGRPFSHRRVPAACLGGLVVLAALLGAAGCGDDDPVEIVITWTPWSLDFDRANQFFLVERQSMSVWKFVNTGTVYSWTGQLLPPASGGFDPWGVAAGKSADNPVLFVSSPWEDEPQLLALSPAFSESRTIDEAGTLLAETAGPTAQDPFIEPRAVASIFLGGAEYRVFVADANTVQVFDYDAAAPAFTFVRTLTSPGSGACPTAFREVYGLACDPDGGALYVTDRNADTLYRFSGVTGGGGPACDAEVSEWPAGDPTDELDEPEGVAFLAGQVSPDLALIVVADADNDRVVAFTWEGGAFQPAEVPDNFEPFQGARPFDTAFDQLGNLWATYPDVSAIGGPKPASNP